MTPSSPARPLPAFAAADLAALSRYLPACVLADGGGDIDPGSVLPPRQRRFSGAVLVADIAGFSSLTEGLAARGPEGAEQLAQVLDAWFGHMTGVALDHGGDVVDFVGDALVVVWPAQELQAAALQAARCALALQAAVAAVAADTGLTLAQRIGLGAGELSLFTVGGLGGQWHWLVAGAPVAQAATAYAQGQPGDTVVDAESWPLLAAHCHGQPLQAAAGWRLLDAGSPALPAAIATPAAKPGWLARYLPASLLERHASGATAWRGEFRTLSVLMIGLPGLDPATADALAQLQGAVGGIQRELLRGGGRIERLSMDDKGISLLVAFGLPRASFDDDASRALRAAWGVSATLAERGISGSIGVTTGRVFCGDSGGTRRRHLSLAGASVNAAARLMQQHDGLLCDAATASAAARAWNFAAVEDDHTTAAPRYRPTPRAIPVARRSDSLLLGRDAEQQQLDRTLQGLGGDTTVLLVGEAGIGKSRLLADAVQRADGHGLHALSTAGSAVEQGTPYFPWRQLLVLALQDDPGADPARLREALVARIGDDRQLLDWLPLLNDVLPLQIPDNVISAQITGAARAGALQELVLQLLRRRDTALLLVLDDLHWWDEASLALLSALLPRLPQLPVVAATRPLDGSNTELPAALTRRQLRLESLSSEAAAQLAARTLGLSEGASLPPAFVDFLYQRTAGNPFFCEELSLALRDAGLIAVQGDGLRLAPEMDGDPGLSQAPTTLRGAIVSRFDRLGQAAQAALKMASVIGREFDPAALGVLLGQRELDATLEELRQADLLRSTGVPGADSAYRFKHALLRDVVYELLPFAQRRELHRKVALWIEQGPDPVSRAAELSGHWESVGDIGKALDYLERAAQHAYSHNANREAIRHVQRARGLQQQHRLELPVARQAEWEAILGDANQELFEFGRSVEHYHQALLLLRQPGSVSAARRLWLLLREAAVQFLHRLWSPAGNRSETALEQRAAHIHQRLSEIAFMGNQPAELLYRTLASVNLAESADFTYARVGGYAGLAMACVAVGRLGLAQDYSERSVRVAEAGGPADVAYAELGRMVYRITCAEWNEVHVAYAAGARLYLALGNIGRWQQICAIDAYASLLQGNYADAQHELAALAGDGGAALPPQIDAWLAGGRAWLALSRDDLAALAPALVHLEAVRQLELGHSERLLCTGLHAAALLATGEREGAERLATMALRMLREQPPIPYYLLVALSSIAEVWFRLLEDEPSPARRQLLLHRAGQTVAMSRRFSRMVPCNRPRALLLQARRAWLLGRTRAAAGYWRKALIQAQQLQMPREQAEALHALGHRVAADRAEAQDQRHRAAMLFAQLGIQPPH